MAEAAAARPLGQGGQALAQVVRERTGGNPFLAGELLRHLAETGGLGGGDVTEAAAGPAVDDVPESVRWVVGQRLARLGGPVEHVLGVVAVIGQQAELALLRRAAGLGWDDLLAALDVAVAARLLEERPALPAATPSTTRSCEISSTGGCRPASGPGPTGRSARPSRNSPAAPTGSTNWPTTSRWPASPTPTGRWATPSGRASRPRPATATRRRPTATARRWPCWSGPGGRRADPERRVELLCGQAGAGPRPARPARPPTSTCWRPPPPARPGRPTAWPGPPSGWAARPASGRPTSASRSRPACSTRPWRPPAAATARPGPSCWPVWPAGGRWAGARGRGAGAGGPGARAGAHGFAEAVAMARRLGDRRTLVSVLADRGEGLERRPAARGAGGRPGRLGRAGPPGRRAGRRRPDLRRRAGPGRAPCWPPATWTASTG